jgi:hypothetical protein
MLATLRLIIPAPSVAAFAACVLPAAAASGFFIETGNWFVISLTNSCYAANRPAVEYNESPYNSLTVHAPKDGGFLFEVAFWPKSFEPGAHYRLSLRAEGGDSHEMDADAVADYAVEARDPAPDVLLKDLQTAKTLHVRVHDVQVSLTFDTSKIGDILTKLDDCRRLIGHN